MTDNPIERQSEAIKDLYRELADEAAIAREAESIAQDLTEDEARFAASQWVMIWRRFRRNRAAIAGGDCCHHSIIWSPCLAISSRPMG